MSHSHGWIKTTINTSATAGPAEVHAVSGFSHRHLDLPMMCRFRSLLWLACIATGGLLAYHFLHVEPVMHPPGVLVRESPRQRLLAPGNSWRVQDFTITALAEYEIRARVLHTKRYWFGRESNLSPLDLALGWGPMSDQAVVDRLNISQGGRWYLLESRRPPLPQRVMSGYSANVHIIPADAEIERLLHALRVGDIIRMRGYLVAAEDDQGWRWRSSLSRTDAGDGACEILWVEQLEIEF